MKERVTLTIETEILERVDGRVDGYAIKNRSHAVELLLLQALGAEAPRKALILAAGKGRLRPINEELPMSMLPIHGKPVLEHVIDLLKNQNVRDIIIGVSYKKESIKAHFGDGKRFGVSITYIEENEPMGTASLLRLARPLLDGPFIVTNGDDLKNVDIADMFKFHKQNQAEITIALTTVDDPSEYGVATLRGNHILEFSEKPKSSTTRLINAGLYIFQPSALDKLTDADSSIVRHLFPKVAKSNSLMGYSFDGQWFDTGTTKGYEEALKYWKDLC